MVGISDSANIKIIVAKIPKAVLPRSQNLTCSWQSTGSVYRYSYFQVARKIAGWSTLKFSGHLVTHVWLFPFCRLKH